MQERNYFVIMQLSDRTINDGIRLSNIFTSKRVAQEYADHRREMDKFDYVEIVTRRVESSNTQLTE